MPTKTFQVNLTARSLAAIASLTLKEEYRDIYRVTYLADVVSIKHPDHQLGTCLIHTNGHHLLFLSDVALPDAPPPSGFLANPRAVDSVAISKLAPSTKWALANIPSADLPEVAPGGAETWELYLSDLVAQNWVQFEASPFPQGATLNLGEMARCSTVLKSLGALKHGQPRVALTPGNRALIIRGAFGDSGHYALVVALGIL